MFILLVIIIIDIIVISYTIQKIKLQRKVYNLISKTFELRLDFIKYLLRSAVLEEKNYSYDTVFSVSDNDNYNISQKQFISIMYKQIEEIDKLILEIPEELINKDYLNHYYDVRREIRTEKLINENTTF